MPPMGVIRSRLRYGVNEATSWRQFALGPHRERIRARLCAIHTEIIRIYVFDRYTPDPVTDWPSFARYVQAALDVGATPMITFTRFRPPFDDTFTVRWFARRCGDVVWNSIEQWGGDAVREWYWCIWNDPNSEWNYPGFTFDQYREIYLEVAHGIMRWMGQYLGGRRALIGGPALDTFQPFWLDWLWRFVHEIDNSLIGFALWHRFGDWRAPGEWGAPRDPTIYRGLLMARTWEYSEQAETVQRLVSERGILNICGKVNVNSHQEGRVSAEVNQTIFGAVYYALALIQLMRGGADGELYWMATDAAGPYGLWNAEGLPTPVSLAKELVVQAVRRNDDVVVEEPEMGKRDLVVVRARGAGERRSALLVHLTDRSQSYRLADVLGQSETYATLRKVDGETGTRIVTSPLGATITFNGPGVAIVATDGACSE